MLSDIIQMLGSKFEQLKFPALNIQELGLRKERLINRVRHT